MESKLWDYLSEEHGLTLLDSEMHDILELARQEIELPDGDEVEGEFPVIEYQKKADDIFMGRAIEDGAYNAFEKYSKMAESNKFKQEGAEWAFGKVRNPYPKTM